MLIKKTKSLPQRKQKQIYINNLSISIYIYKNIDRMVIQLQLSDILIQYECLH